MALHRIVAACAVLAAGLAAPAHAQHASDNPLAAADDAFGLTLGLESVGMYGPGNVRGFNPEVAGNVRIDGLYFDLQGGLSNRVVEGSTIRIGVSEIGYAFPAPTGIVDYELRHTGADKPGASVVASAGPYEARGLSVDAVVPVAGKDLQVPIGASWQVSTQTTAGTLPGYTSRVASVGATPELRIGQDWRVRAILDWTRTTGAQTLPVVFPAGDFEPAGPPTRYIGQDWAQGSSVAFNVGAIVHGRLADDWSLSAGLFRSVANNPVSFSDLYVNTQANGSADHVLIGYPDQFAGSDSGELRLTRHLAAGSWRHDVIAVVRGRDTQAYYDGGDTVDVGNAQIGQGVQVPEPSFAFTGRTSDRVRLLATGVAWRGRWDRIADFSLGLMREDYRKSVVPASGPASQTGDSPLRAYGQASCALGERLTVYAGATQGLEDSGIAPTGSVNHGAILPDARTWQADAGLRYGFARDVKLIAGVFQIDKPYFNLDSANVDRQLAMQKAKGIELSLSGMLVKDLQVAAGAVLGEDRLSGTNLAAQGLGPIAYGQPHFQTLINADYTFTAALSADLTLYRASASPLSLDNRVQQAVPVMSALGGRYKFKADGVAATLRVQIFNPSKHNFWNWGNTPGLMQFSPRTVITYLTADV